MNHVLFSAFCKCGAITLHFAPTRGDNFCPTCGDLLRAMEPASLRRMIDNTFHGEMREYLSKAYEQYGLLKPTLRLVNPDETPPAPEPFVAQPVAIPSCIDAEFDDDPCIDIRLRRPELPPEDEHPDFAAIREAWCGETWERDQRTAGCHGDTHLFVQRDGRLASNLPDDGSGGWRLFNRWGDIVLHLAVNRRVVGIARSMVEILGPDGPCSLERLIAQHGGPCVSTMDDLNGQIATGASWTVPLKE